MTTNTTRNATAASTGLARLTGADTFDLFCLSGALGYPWYEVTRFPTVDPRGDLAALGWLLVFDTSEVEDDEQDVVTVRLGHTDLLRAVGRCARRSVPVSDECAAACRQLVFGRFDEVDFDANTADEVLQVAAFGQVCYG